MGREITEGKIESLGYDEWFRDAGSGHLRDGFSPARIVEVNRGNFRADYFSEIIDNIKRKE